MQARIRPVSAMRSTIPQSAVYFRLALAHLAVELTRGAETRIVAAGDRRRAGQRTHAIHPAGDLRGGRLAGSTVLSGLGHRTVPPPAHACEDRALASEHRNRIHRGAGHALEDERGHRQHELPAAVLRAGLGELLEGPVVD